MRKKNRAEDEMILEQAQFADVEDEDEEIKTRVLKPCMSIDVCDILNGWMKEWSETPEICTEEWNLVAFPVLADGKVALLFESPILVFENDEEGGLLTTTLENQYRVLVYDPKTGEQTGKYRFKVYGGYTTTVFFKNGKLYATVSVEGRRQYTALQMWPGSDDEHQIRIGDDINCLAATEAGDIIVSYNGGDERMEEAEEEMPRIRIFHADGSREDISHFYDEVIGGEPEDFVIDVTLDNQDRIWAVLSDTETAVMFDRKGSITTWSLPVPDVTALVMPSDGSCIYASSEDVEVGYTMFRIPISGKDIIDEELEICAIKTPKGDAVFSDGYSFLKNLAAAIIDDVIYIVNLDEQ